MLVTRGDPLHRAAMDRRRVLDWRAPIIFSTVENLRIVQAALSGE